MKGVSKGIIAVIVVVIIVIVGGVAAYYATKKPSVTTSTTSTSTTTSIPPVTSTTTTFTTTSTSTTTSVSSLSPVAVSSYATVAGTPINFVLSSFTPSSNKYALFYPGNGKVINTTSKYVNVTYNYPGHYLVYYNVYQNGVLTGSSLSNLIEITVAPSIPESLAPLVTVPTITFNITRNPTAPVFTTGETVYLSGGFLQPPSGQNMTIYEYVWNFGNGQTQTVMANQTTFLPETDPVNVTYSSPGLYAVSLTVVTKNVSSGKTYNYTTYQTVAVSGNSITFSLFKFSSNIPSPGVIQVAENQPGGPYSLDPDIDYEVVGFEVIANVYQTLLLYNGSNTTSFIPYAASEVPSVQNGLIKNNYTEYIFPIRSGLYFSNGDPVTAYDVWYSIIRALLFVGGLPGTPDWIIAQYLVPNVTAGVPIVSSPNDTQAFEEIMNSVTYNNQTNEVIFHLYRPTAPQALFTALADPLSTGILDAKWLEQVGAGINFTPAGFYQYEQQANVGNYNQVVDWSPMGSGPYMVKSLTPGQSIVLAPNPYYNGVPGVPKPNDTVIIYWVKDPNTAYEMFASGQADILEDIPTQFIPLVEQLESQGQAKIYSFPALTELFYVFNANISQPNLKALGSQYSIPSYYFANPLVRKAFAYAFNYTEYLNDILGNEKYHFNFGNYYCGVIIPGLPYYVPPSELTGCPTFNLTYAKQLMEESGFYNISVNFPIVIFSGDLTDFTGAQMWSQLLNEMDPNIHATPIYMPGSTMMSYWVPGLNGQPIFTGGWIADFPLASDFTNPMYLQGGFFPAGAGWNVSYFENLSKYFASKGNMTLANIFANESKEYNELNTLIEEANNAALSGNNNLAAVYYKEAEQIAVNLYLYVYTYQENMYWIIKPYMIPYKNQISYQENPMIGGGGNSLFYWWFKG
jgi:ABC-type transport system substrate-binding protein